MNDLRWVPLAVLTAALLVAVGVSISALSFNSELNMGWDSPFVDPEDDPLYAEYVARTRIRWMLELLTPSAATGAIFAGIGLLVVLSRTRPAR